MALDAAGSRALVEALGAQALLLYAGLLATLLLGMTALWWLGRRYAGTPGPPVRAAGAGLLLGLAAGFVVLVTGAAVFAEVAEALGSGPRVGELDELFSAAVQRSITPATLQFFAALTHLADTATLTGLAVLGAALLGFRRRRWLALGWVLAISGNAVLNTTLKGIFERTRPVHDNAIFQAPGFSFPSGHSSGAVVAYGMLAYVLLHSLPPATARRAGLPLVLAASALAFSIGCSRIFIGVHYATDVLAGFASGSAWLAVCIGSIGLTRHYRRSAD